MVSVRRSFKHSYREQTTHNADPERKGENLLFHAKSTVQAMKVLRDRLPLKIRKNGVLCVEHLITASPEWFDNKSLKQENEYFQTSLDFLRKKWGEDNVICGGVHRDEKTPHMFVYVVPLDEDTGRLNCRKWLGEKGALSVLQDDFFEAVGEKHGLERGVKGSKAKHQTLKKYYSGLTELERLESYRKPSKADFLKASMGITVGAVESVEEAAKLVEVSGTRIKQLARENSEVLNAHARTHKKLLPLSQKLTELEAIEVDFEALKVKNKSDNEELELLRLRDVENQKKLSSYRQIVNKNKDSSSTRGNNNKQQEQGQTR